MIATAKILSFQHCVGIHPVDTHVKYLKKREEGAAHYVPKNLAALAPSYSIQDSEQTLQN